MASVSIYGTDTAVGECGFESGFDLEVDGGRLAGREGLVVDDLAVVRGARSEPVDEIVHT